jgi:hypothetical protein
MAQGIGLAGGFGAGGVRDALVDLIAQRMAQAEFEEKRRQASNAETLARETLGQRKTEASMEDARAKAGLRENQRQFGETLGLNVKKLGEDTRQFDTTHGENRRQFDTGLEFKKGESTREQGNTERGFGLKERELRERERANRAGESLDSLRVGAVGAKADQTRGERASSARASIETALKTIRRLRGDDDKGNKGTGAAGFTGAVGAKGPASAFGLLERPMGGTDAADFAAAFDTLKAQLTVPELEKMRGQGALSDRDVAMLSSGASSLSRAQSEAAFLAELNRLDDKFTEVLGALPGGGGGGGSGTPSVGDVVNVGGKRVRISKLFPDGTFDGEEVP